MKPTSIWYGIIFTISLGIACYGVNALSSIPKHAAKPRPRPALACDQELYDAIYRAITAAAIARGAASGTVESDRKISMDRASEIMSLRRLCRGQRSSYELSNPIQWSGQ